MLGWGWGVAVYTLPTVIAGTGCLGIFVHACILCEFWRGRHKRLSVYPDGLTYDDRDRRIDVARADIKAIYIGKKQLFTKGGWNMVFATRNAEFEINLVAASSSI